MTPKILIPATIMQKLQFIVDNCDLEVSGLGTVIYDKEENAYRVTNAILLDQEVGSAHTDLDDQAVAKALYDTRNDEGELAFWWHSHVNMNTFWSSQDHATMEAIGKNGLCVAVVMNKKEEIRGAIVMAPQNMPTVKLDDVKIEVEYTYDFDTTALLAEIKQKVRPKTFAHHTNTSTPFWKSPAIETPKTYGNYTQNELNILANESNATSVLERKFALDEWSRLDKTERLRYANFEDFFEEYLWGEYSATRTPSYYV